MDKERDDTEDETITGCRIAADTRGRWAQRVQGLDAEDTRRFIMDGDGDVLMGMVVVEEKLGRSESNLCVCVDFSSSERKIQMNQLAVRVPTTW